MKVAVWNQTLTATWRPRLSFYEQRLSLLKSFEADGAMHAFRFEPGVVGVRLHDNNHELTVSSTYLSLRASTPAADLGRIRQAGERVFKVITPERVTGVRLDLQHVGALSGDYAERRRATATAWFGEWAKETKVTDHALLVDGESRSGRAKYKMEFGIVDSKELPFRLSRALGRVAQTAELSNPAAALLGDSLGGAASEGRAPIRWNEMSLPDVALYADSSWRSDGPLNGEDPYQAIWQYWEEMEEEATALLERLVLLAENQA